MREKNGELKGSRLATIRYLAARSDSGALVRGVSLHDIAGHLGLSWDRAKRIMRELRESGAVETVQRGSGRQKSIYRLHLTTPSGA